MTATPRQGLAAQALFQIHYAAGIGVGLYVVAASISGSIIVYRNELSPSLAVEWIVKLHENLLFGETGRLRPAARLHSPAGTCGPPVDR